MSDDEATITITVGRITPADGLTWERHIGIYDIHPLWTQAFHARAECNGVTAISWYHPTVKEAAGQALAMLLGMDFDVLPGGNSGVRGLVRREKYGVVEWLPEAQAFREELEGRRAALGASHDSSDSR